MILLCGIPTEPPLRLVIEAAGRQSVPYVLFNQREAEGMDILLRLRGGQASGMLRVQGQDWPLESFTGVYLRLMDHRHLPEYQAAGKTQPDLQTRITRLHEIFNDWVEITPCRVMNRSSDMLSNLSKPYQAQSIVRAGFETPVTLITNQPEAVQVFAHRHNQVVYKSISSVRSIVSRLAGPKAQELHKIRFLPTQFQAYVPGVNLRVHVVGEQVFATEIVSEATDYRYAGQEGLETTLHPTQLPATIEQRCLDLSRALRLPLCGIDLKRTPDDRYVCFEVNPSPGYSYYQENTGQDIAGAIVSFLSA